MSPARYEPDELLEQVLEDDRAAALQEFREREGHALALYHARDTMTLYVDNDQVRYAQRRLHHRSR
jgi:hypothetical protein